MSSICNDTLFLHIMNLSFAPILSSSMEDKQNGMEKKAKVPSGLTPFIISNFTHCNEHNFSLLLRHFHVEKKLPSLKQPLFAYLIYTFPLISRAPSCLQSALFFYSSSQQTCEVGLAWLKERDVCHSL